MLINCMWDDDDDDDDKKDLNSCNGWDNIVEYIEPPTTWWEVWKFVQKLDVDNYLGKDCEWRKLLY